MRSSPAPGAATTRTDAACRVAPAEGAASATNTLTATRSKAPIRRVMAAYQSLWTPPKGVYAPMGHSARSNEVRQRPARLLRLMPIWGCSTGLRALKTRGSRTGARRAHFAARESPFAACEGPALSADGATSLDRLRGLVRRFLPVLEDLASDGEERACHRDREEGADDPRQLSADEDCA
jgi:hypothetical protein